MVTLPTKVDSLANAWEFQADEELPGGHCSLVFANASRVLKFPLRGEESVSGWRMAIAHSGLVGPVVFECDPESGSLLMERVIPGTKLSGALLSEHECQRLFLAFHQAIRAQPVDGLLSLEDYFSHPIPLVRQLLDTQPEVVPLHGDLHHENILIGPHGPVLIDPKGLYGDPALEAAAFVRNPIPWIADAPDLANFLLRRILSLADGMDVSAQRVWAWTLADLDWDDAASPWAKVGAALSQLRDHFPGPLDISPRAV